MTVKTVGSSHIGMVRAENQDAFWYSEPVGNQCFAVVCDGMGGANGGSCASSIAKNTALENWNNRGNKKPHALFEKIITESNKNIYDEAEEDQDLAGMGTTMVFVWVEGTRLYFGNVGDSRGYHITNGSISQITKDHSAVQQLVDSGHITPRQAKLHPNKNIITRAIGIEEEVEFDFFQVDASPGDIVVLCSDGLSNLVDENEIQFEAFGGDFDDLPQRLIELANSRGGSDNTTVVAIQI